MAMDKMNIPKTITVGFNKREDTYTKKLAYIIYTDAKGVLRKEKSWQGWRDKKIDPETYDNTPQSGFVLNKKVGGNNYSWNPRNTYVRVFDPRGFEFEISIPNLLFILQETSSIKGKGLEGEFAYAWDGTELVLLPITCEEYKNSVGFTELQSQKISKTDMVEGRIYVNKDNIRVMYLGRHDWTEYDRNNEYIKNYNEQHPNSWNTGWNTGWTNLTKSSFWLVTKKKHVFVELDSNKYWVQDGFTKIGRMESPDISPIYADKYDEMKTKCPNIGSSFEIILDEFEVKSLIPRYDKYFYISFTKGNDRYNINYSHSDSKLRMGCYPEYYNSISIEDTKMTYITTNYAKASSKIVTPEEIELMTGQRHRYKNKSNGQILHTID